MGRNVNTALPIHLTKPELCWPNKVTVEENLFCNKEKYAKAFDKHNSIHTLPKLPFGDCVTIKTDQEKCWDTTGTIRSDEADIASRSCIIETDDGALLKRNQSHFTNTLHDSNITSDKESKLCNEKLGPRRYGRTIKPPERLIEIK